MPSWVASWLTCKPMPTDEEIDARNRRRWTVRRRMAIISFGLAIAYPLIAFVAERASHGSSKIFVDLAASYYAFATAVVGVYIGFAAWSDERNK